MKYALPPWEGPGSPQTPVPLPAPEEVVLLCPVCAATVDALSDQQQFECARCGQVWSMVVSLERIEKSSVI